MKRLKFPILLISMIGLMMLAACSLADPVTVDTSSDSAETAEVTPTEAAPAATEAAVEDSAETMSPEISTRESGLQLTTQNLGDVTVHTLTAPEQVFANSTHIIETPNNLVLIDTQFLLPNALDFRAYADSLGKPIERVLITHEHPDHMLGSEAFADLDIYALAEVSDSIDANGQAEVDEKQADFGSAIASTFVVPIALEPGSVDIDGVTFIFEVMKDAEAETQLITKVPDYGIVSVGDVVYSGVHLILAGAPPTWTQALESLKADSANYPIVLAGHGVPGGPDLYDQNIAWLAKAGELMGTATSGEEFKTGLVKAFPELGMDAAIDFVLPFMFPEPEAEMMAPEVSVRESGLQLMVQDLGGVTVHALTAPEQVFANSTYIIETENNLVLIDTQFLLPNALDFRAYADSLGKPIERVLITHEHPDHMLGSEAFADLDIYALAEVSDAIDANGQAEVDEKQADFGPAIASTFVVPIVLEPGSVDIDGVTFIFEVMKDAEAETQLITKVPDYGIVSVGDVVYSGVHLILAGAPPTWTQALESLKADSVDYPMVLAGHGVPGGPELYDQNIAWLAKAGELMGTATSGEEFKAGLVEAFPDLGMDAAIDFVLPFMFPTTEGESSMNLIEVITVELAEGISAETFVPTDQVIRDGYASLQPGYLARETAVSEVGQVRLSVHWESKADSDASIAGFGEAPGLEAFMGNLNAETMVIKQYDLRSSTSGEVTFPGAGATEVITVKLLDGSDEAAFVAANQALEESYIAKQPGFIAREVAVSEEGEWAIIVHWETVEDSAASIAKFEEAPGVEVFMSFLDFETMANTVYVIQE